jgi:ketosteroid isomerase-like protein
MSGENVQLVQRSYELLAELREAGPGTLERAFRECFDESLEVHIPAAYPEGAQVFRGRRGLKRWVDSTKEVWDEWRFQQERFFDAGDQVVVFVRVVARGGSSGVSLDRKTAHVWTLKDRRVTRCEVYLDRSQALKAVAAEGANVRSLLA